MRLPAQRELGLAIFAALCMATADAADADDAAPGRSLADLSLEELGDIEVLSVSREPERLAAAPSSIFVITNEQIRRAGPTSLGEALRIAPNLQVARINSVGFAITARGFNNSLANKLLVLVDGRTVYTPLFSGVFWDQQDLVLADVDRIEVISGPGATLWGANAVNGVINVITRSAAETQGGFVSAGGGNFESQATLRYGGRLGGSGHYRAYAKTASFDATQRASGASALDAWTRQQVGFRADWDLGRDSVTLQADVADGRSQDRGTAAGFAFGRIETSGANVLGRFKRDLGDGSSLSVQSYLDHSERDDLLFFRPRRDTFDVEAQHGFERGANDVIWGGGYRHMSDEIGTGFITTFIPGSRDLEWANVFVQDRIQLRANLETTVGLKLERNDYTGTESLPSARLAWRPSDDRLLWTAVSRAVRAPSRVDREVFFPGTPPFIVVGGPNFQSEVANVVELGYRAQPAPGLSYSATLFRHDWDKLRSGTAVPVQLENRIEGDVYGVEAWANWRVTERWELSGGLNTLDKDLVLEPGSTDPAGVNNPTLANDADFQWTLRSALQLPIGLQLDVAVRRVDSLPNPRVPRYTAVDARLAWDHGANLTVDLNVRNLFDAKHPEFEAAPNRSELPRTVLLKVDWRFGG
ncbi:MAG TPA: TonB-dependent receptor [Gammaproteobacteria bacterium]|nr:TonB-dependent receptor [Gammaproteobacteria bacterium]